MLLNQYYKVSTIVDSIVMSKGPNSTEEKKKPNYCSQYEASKYNWGICLGYFTLNALKPKSAYIFNAMEKITQRISDIIVGVLGLKIKVVSFTGWNIYIPET